MTAARCHLQDPQRVVRVRVGRVHGRRLGQRPEGFLALGRPRALRLGGVQGGAVQRDAQRDARSDRQAALCFSCSLHCTPARGVVLQGRARW